MSLTNFNIAAGDQSLAVAPTANGELATIASLNCQAFTGSSTEREFMVNFGLNSNTGGGDKVSLFSGMEALAGTSSCWTVYSTLGMNVGSGGDYNAICYECDLNNNQGHRGNDGNFITDFTQANAVGLSVTGNSAFTSTSAILISSQPPAGNPPQWARGMTTVGDFSFCSFLDHANAPTSIQFDGNYSIAAINLTALHGNPGAQTPTALFMGNNQAIAWQTNTAAAVVSDTVDSGNLRIVGNGSDGVFVGAILSPLSAGVDLGSTTNYWGRVFSNQGVVTPSDLTLKTDIRPLPPMTETIKNVRPISFKWRDQTLDNTTHFGFDANEIKTTLGDFAGHFESAGVQYLAKDELIAVLWQANREMLARIEALENAP